MLDDKRTKKCDGQRNRLHIAARCPEPGDKDAERRKGQKATYKTDIVLDRENILNLQLMCGGHIKGHKTYFYGASVVRV